MQPIKQSSLILIFVTLFFFPQAMGSARKITTDGAVQQIKKELCIGATNLPNDFMERLRRKHIYEIRAEIFKKLHPESDDLPIPNGQSGNDDWTVRFSKNWYQQLIEKKTFENLHNELKRLKRSIGSVIKTNPQEELPDNFMEQVSQARSIQFLHQLRTSLGMKNADESTNDEATGSKSENETIAENSNTINAFQQFESDFNTSFCRRQELEIEEIKLKSLSKKSDDTFESLFSSISKLDPSNFEASIKNLFKTCSLEEE